MKDTELIKQKLDIVDVLGEYIQLKPSGINHKGLCPFHQEKSPSFMVNRERQSWHCFGCSKGGDIFSFVQEIEGMDFIEALKILASKAGIQLTNAFEDKVRLNQKNRIKEIHSVSASFYNNFLTKIDVSKLAREYLKGREITDKTIEEWQIGFIPNQWDLLTQYLFKKGYSIDDLVLSGLTIKHETSSANSSKIHRVDRGVYDRFRGRIMFPICDVHGNVIGFTGRILVDTEKSVGKYLNTPQTPIYDKSSVIFGLHKAKQEIRKKNFVVMVEGQMDVIACHQAGMENVVATSGTAMTEQQITLIKRYSENMSIAFDGDIAGVRAVKRGIDLSIAQGLFVKVIEIPEGKGKDPDECIKIDKDVWFSAVEHASPIMDWYFSRAFLGKDLSNPREKQEIVDKLLPEIARIPFAVEKDHWLRELSGKLGVDTTILREDMKRILYDKRQIQDNEYKDTKIVVQKKIEKTKSEKLFDRYLMALLGGKEMESIKEVNEQLFEITRGFAHYPLYEIIKIKYSTNHSLDIEEIRVFFEDKERENPVDVLLMEGSLFLSGLDATELRKEASVILINLQDALKQDILKTLESDMQKAESVKDQKLMEDISKKVRHFHSL